MLSTAANDVMQLITRAETFRKRHITNTTQMVRRYVGNWYRTDSKTKRRPENMIYAFMATMIPSLIFDNPAVTCSAKRSITHKGIAQAMAMGMNGWIKDVNLRQELEMLAVDMLFAYGVALTGIEPTADNAAGYGVNGSFADTPLRPFLQRISPSNFLIDPDCDSPDAARFMGHQFQMDHDDLLGNEQYDQKVVKQLTGDGEARVGRSTSERAFSEHRAGADDRKERVTLYQIFLPEHRKIGTIALNQTGRGEWIRALRDFHGPRRGPYTLIGVYTVPDQVLPLSPVAAMAEQDDELNAHATAAAIEAASGKNIVLVNSDSPEVATAIEGGAANSVVRVKGLNANMVMPVAIGGTTRQRVEYLQMLLSRTDRISGQSEATRGRAQGVTATEARLADANGDSRSEFLHLKYRDGVKDALSRVAWYIFHDPAVVFPVSADDPQTNQPFEGLFLGGPQPGQEDTSWGDFNLDIEPMSMRRIDPAMQQQQAQLTVQMAAQIAPMIIQFPYMNWPAMLDMIGEANNIPDFAKLVLNQQGLQMIQAGMMPGQPAGAMTYGQPQIPSNASPLVQNAAMGGGLGVPPQPMGGMMQPQGGGAPLPPLPGFAGQTGAALQMRQGA